MQPPLLYSIEAVEPHQVFHTGCRPVLVLGSDLEYYVCKYQQTGTSSNLLAREYLAAQLLRLWQLPVPDFVLMHIQPEHLPASLGLGIVRHDVPAFGSRYHRDYKEVDAFLAVIPRGQRGQFDSTGFLTIAFFDLWIGNDDRHPTNYNLLLAAGTSGYQFIPIDHNHVFHGGNQMREHHPLSFQESLLSSPLLRMLFKKGELSHGQRHLQALEKEWYLRHLRCKDALSAILASLPAEWRIDIAKTEAELQSFLFSDQWFEQCWQSFLYHLQQANRP